MDRRSGRYSVSEAESFEPGSNDEVLRNKLGITSRDVMEEREEAELLRAEEELISLYRQDHQFTANDICYMHKCWLEPIYYFAGNYRTVNMGKGDFQFAASSQIARLMAKFENEFLSEYTPCHYEDLDELSYALGIVHIELILIHPFREGNGRVARLLADLMAVQAGQPLLNYQSIDQINNLQGFQKYILAIHAGHDGDYMPIKEIFKVILIDSVI